MMPFCSEVGVHRDAEHVHLASADYYRCTPPSAAILHDAFGHCSFAANDSKAAAFGYDAHAHLARWSAPSAVSAEQFDPQHFVHGGLKGPYLHPFEQPPCSELWRANDCDEYLWQHRPVQPDYRPMQTLLEDTGDLFPSASPHSLPAVAFESASGSGSGSEPDERQAKFRRRSETAFDCSYLQPLLQLQHHSAGSSVAEGDRTFVGGAQACGLKAAPGPEVARRRKSARPQTLQEKKSLVCAVCGDAASCQHYGVRTCEGCKGFFKRTVQKNSQYTCLASKNCPVDKRRRNKCQFCRYMKCISVGMSRDVVRTDSLKGRRGRLPSQRQNSGGCSSASPVSSPTCTPADESFLASLLRAHTDCMLKDDLRDYSQFVPPEMMQCGSDELVKNWQRFADALASTCDAISDWSSKLSGFCELNAYDQRVLLSSAFLELFALRIACQASRNAKQECDGNTSPSSVRPSDDCNVLFGNGKVLHKCQLAPFLGEWFEQICDFAQSLQRLELDQTALACMTALVLITERPGLVDSNSVAELQLKVVESLRNHCLLNCAAPSPKPLSSAAGRAQAPLLFSRILGKLPDLRSLSEQGFRKFCQLKSTGYLLPEKVDTLLFAINGNNNNNNSFLLHAQL